MHEDWDSYGDGEEGVGEEGQDTTDTNHKSLVLHTFYEYNEPRRGRHYR